MAPETQRAALTWGDSNHSSSNSATESVITLTKSPVPCTSRPFSFQAKRASSSRSAGDLAPTAGGVIKSSGRTRRAILARYSLKRGQASASFVENLATSARSEERRVGEGASAQ